MADNRNMLQDHMAKFSGENYVEGWAELWNNKKEDETLSWDRGCHSAALEDLLTNWMKSKQGVFAKLDGRRKALVPGCGTGYDVQLLASFGFDTYGLDYSHTAIEHAKKYAATSSEKYPARDSELGRGNVSYIQADYFADDWVEKLGESGLTFDLIYDYTFFCALHRWLRPRWAARHCQLLAPAPTGSLICLEWPRHKDPKLLGPPYAAPSEAYFAHLTHPGEKVVYDSNGRIIDDPAKNPSSQGLVRVAHYQPERTYATGKDAATGEVIDRISVWQQQDRSGH